jgi:hypothetical protein
MTGKQHGFVGITTEMGAAVFTGYNVDGFPVVQHDAQGEEPRVDAYELHHQFGFWSMPRDPDADKTGKPIEGKACNLQIGKQGNEIHAWLGYDPRFIPVVPKPKKGGSMRYSAAGSFEIFDGDDGTSTLYVPIPGEDKAHVFTVGIDGNGLPWIGLEHSNGMSLVMLERSITIKNAAGDAYLEINDDGITQNGNSKTVGGLLVGNVASAVALTKVDPLVQLLGLMAAAIDGKLGTPSTTVGLVTAAAAALRTTLLSAT